MNYRAIAEHLAKHCRNALEGLREHVPYEGVTEDRIVVTMPTTNAGRRLDYDEPSYSFFIRGYVGDESSPSWTLFITVSKDKHLDIMPRGNVPSHVFQCLEKAV